MKLLTTFKGINGLNLYILPIACTIFLDMFEIWCFQLQLEFMKIPRYLINSFFIYCFVINFDSNVLFHWLIIRVEYYVVDFINIK